jgi:hypothetical protein
MTVPQRISQRSSEKKMTTVKEPGTSLAEIVSELILLERDATAAYVRILPRLQSGPASEKISCFVETRQRRLAELTKMSFMLRSAVPDESAATHYLPTGRITVAGLDGDAAILEAMQAGENETVTAYERASGHPDAAPKCQAMFERCLRDALQHRAWVENAASAARDQLR